MLGYSQLQQREFSQEAAGYRAAKHQSFVGTGYFDAVQTASVPGHIHQAPWRKYGNEQFTAPAAKSAPRATSPDTEG